MSKQTWISAEMALCSMLSHSFSSTELLLLSGSWRAKQDILSSLGAHQPDAKLSHAAAQQSANVWHAMTATECQCMACNDSLYICRAEIVLGRVPLIPSGYQRQCTSHPAPPLWGQGWSYCRFQRGERQQKQAL